MNSQKLPNYLKSKKYNKHSFNWIKFYLLNKREKVQKNFNDFFENLNDDSENSLKKIELFLNNGAVVHCPQYKINIRDNFIKNENFINTSSYFSNFKIYDTLISSDFLSKKHKSDLDVYLMLSILHDLIITHYYNHSNPTKEYELESLYLKSKKNKISHIDPLFEFEKIIERKNVFLNQKCRFLTLNIIFSYAEIFDNIGSKLKLLCYREFSRLNIISKKIITGILIKNRNEEAIFNLIGYGLKLDWEVYSGNEKTNIGFELFKSNDWVKTIYQTNLLNIRFTNTNGENLLFHINSCTLEDKEVELIIRRKINELNSFERYLLFFQLSKEGLTPLMRAVALQDEILIDFILSFDINPWDKVVGAPIQESALDFLNNNILLTEDKTSWGALIDFLKDSFWYSLAKKWNAEFYYNKLKEEFGENDKKMNEIDKKEVKKSKIKI